MRTFFDTHHIRAKRRLLLVCTLAWLCCLLSLDALHSNAHTLEHASHSCLVCQFGHQPVHTPPVANASSLLRPVYVVVARAAPLVSCVRCQSSPQPRVPRGPPV